MFSGLTLLTLKLPEGLIDLKLEHKDERNITMVGMRKMLIALPIEPAGTA